MGHMFGWFTVRVEDSMEVFGISRDELKREGIFARVAAVVQLRAGPALYRSVSTRTKWERLGERLVTVRGVGYQSPRDFEGEGRV